MSIGWDLKRDVVPTIGRRSGRNAAIEIELIPRSLLQRGIQQGRI